MSPTADAPELLLVEDTPSLQMLYRTVLGRAGFAPICVSSGDEARQAFAQIRPPVVLLDMMLPDCDGLGLMREMLTVAPETRVIVITANGSVEKAVEATRKGAYDFLVKPLGDVRLVSSVASAMAESRAKAQQKRNGHQAEKDTFVARSAAMREVQDIITAVARSHAPVFIHGPSGTGKKTCARRIHALSPRATGPFVTVDCGIPDRNALEAALFGGGTGSGLSEDSALRKARGGTLVLLCPQSLPAELQTRLVSALDAEPGMDLHLNGHAAGVRIVSASRTDPGAAMRTGDLQSELYFRLLVLPLSLPVLRDRREDVPEIAQHLLLDIARQEGKTFTRITAKAQAHLQRQPWDGNLHELRNCLRRAVVLNDGPEMTLEMLPSTNSADGAHGMGTTVAQFDLDMALAGMTLAQIDARAIRAAIARHGGSITKAAQELDIAPSTIYRRRDEWSDLLS